MLPERLCSLMPSDGLDRDVGCRLIGAVGRVVDARPTWRPQATWIAPVIRPVTSSGELDGDRACRRPCGRGACTTTRSQTANTSGMRWLIRTTAMPGVAQAADQVEHLGDLAHADRGRRLVHQHDLGLRRAACGRWRPPGAARPTSAGRDRAGRVSDFSSANSSPARLDHRAVVEPAERARPTA